LTVLPTDSREARPGAAWTRATPFVAVIALLFAIAGTVIDVQIVDGYTSASAKAASLPAADTMVTNVARVSLLPTLKIRDLSSPRLWCTYTSDITSILIIHQTVAVGITILPPDRDHSQSLVGHELPGCAVVSLGTQRAISNSSLKWPKPS